MEEEELDSISNRISGEELLKILSHALRIRRDEYVVLVAEDRAKSPFAVLVGIILSQNTNDRNSIKAFEQLRERIGVGLNDILRASIDEISEAIKPAGLWRQKAETIKRVAEALNYLGGEEYLLREDPMRLREKLLEIKGVGEKTVDVFLSVVRKAPVFAVDTHAMRIAIRWGLAKRRNYREVSQALLKYFGPEKSEEAHRLIIALGRRYCKAINPRCYECPIKNYCPSSHKYLTNQPNTKSTHGY
jgi:endonuclease-3